MKLLYCPQCQDLFKLVVKEIRACKCGLAKGCYFTRLEAAHNGKGVPIILNTFDLLDAVKQVRTKGKPRNTICFQIRAGTSAPFNLHFKAMSEEKIKNALEVHAALSDET